ncbi:response regulator transcription factor [Granulicella aggregans]|jgi:two-component system response regulator DesR|uniref:response regulator transcription factor n=1 Tax=Granulicella aggregans TaxID=474949 RepID=UPI0021DF8AF3|nr:response regulator transcription factor [Granulicella aggregans]
MNAAQGKPAKEIQVVLAEDQGMVQGALAVLLGIEPDIEVVAAANDGEEALRAIGRHRPGVLVTDIEMPKLTGLELAGRVRELYPATRVLILTTFARPGYLRRALDAGALGYLLKDRPSTELADAVRRVYRGLRVVDPELAAEAWSGEVDPLSDREREILRRAGEGESTADLARSLRLSDGTVRNYLSEAISKLGAHNRTEAARMARAKGWL